MSVTFWFLISFSFSFHFRCSWTLPMDLCRILGRLHFFWGWRKSWKRKNLRRMILLEVYLSHYFGGWTYCLIIYRCTMHVCSVVHFTHLLTECPCFDLSVLWFQYWFGLTEFKKWVFNILFVTDCNCLLHDPILLNDSQNLALIKQLKSKILK